MFERDYNIIIMKNRSILDGINNAAGKMYSYMIEISVYFTRRLMREIRSQMDIDVIERFEHVNFFPML